MALIQTFSPKDFPKELQKWARKHPEKVRRGFISGALRSIPELVANSPVDTGLYAQSWEVKHDEQSVTIGNTAPHAAIIEFGARPFRPPIGPLLAWAKRVLQDPSQPPNYSQEVWALAIGTRNKIQREGIAPRAVMQNNIDMIMKNMRLEVEREVRR